MDGLTAGLPTEILVGARGPVVLAIQDALDQAGFPPGPLDSDFGPGTEASVLAFQKSQGLLDDGVVGSRTAGALGVALPEAARFPRIDLALACRMFPNTPTPPIARNLPPVLAALQNARLGQPTIVLAALATIRAETEGFIPLDEGISRYNSSPGGRPFDLYDHRRDLGNKGAPDGSRYKGRGFVQLTGRANYQRFGETIGVKLLDTPERANEPDTAARLLAAFLAAVEIPLKRALLDGRLATARRLVNGGCNGEARFADAYLTGARAMGIMPGNADPTA